MEQQIPWMLCKQELPLQAPRQAASLWLVDAMMTTPLLALYALAIR